MSVYQPEDYKDLFRVFQLVSSGNVISDPSKFLAGPPTNPTYFIPGKNWRFRTRYSPVGFPIQTLTDENRTQTVIIKNSAMLDFEYDLTDFAYNGFLSWLLELHDSDFVAYSGFSSRKPGATEYFKQFHGIVRDRVSISWPDNGEPIHISGSLIAAKPVAESTTGPTIGGGAYAAAVTADVVRPADSGADSFAYNSANYKTKGMTVNVQHLYSVLDSDESLFTELMTPISRNISGNVRIFKKQGADSIHADILSGTYRSMSKIIKPYINPNNGTRLDLTNVLLAERDEDDYMSVKSESTIKDYSFSAGNLTLTNLTS
jgi:hypothetical protein